MFFMFVSRMFRFICSLIRVVESGLYEFWLDEVMYAVDIGHVDTRKSVKGKEKYKSKAMDLSIFDAIFKLYAVVIASAVVVWFLELMCQKWSSLYELCETLVVNMQKAVSM